MTATGNRTAIAWGALLCTSLWLGGCASPPPAAAGVSAEASTDARTDVAAETPAGARAEAPVPSAAEAAEAAVPADPEWIAIRIRVRHADATPAAGVTLAGLWGRDGYFGKDDRGGRMVPLRRIHTTDAQGVLQLRVRRSRPHVTLMAYDDAQTTGALVMVDPSDFDGAAEAVVDVTLRPLVTLKGAFHCAEIGGAPQWATNYVYLFGSDGVPDIRVATCAVAGGAFECKLPPGNYGLSHFGKEIVSLWNEVTLESGVHDLGTLKFKPTALAASYGTPLPELNAYGVYGDGEVPAVASLKGRWTFLIYWAYW